MTPRMAMSTAHTGYLFAPNQRVTAVDLMISLIWIGCKIPEPLHMDSFRAVLIMFFITDCYGLLKYLKITSICTTLL